QMSSLRAASATLSTLLPYTTLFRSLNFARPYDIRNSHSSSNCSSAPGLRTTQAHILSPKRSSGTGIQATLTTFGCERMRFSTSRSEEHTSELQSRENLVCRLLLEKK